VGVRGHRPADAETDGNRYAETDVHTKTDRDVHTEADGYIDAKADSYAETDVHSEEDQVQRALTGWRGASLRTQINI
jgi:hypothetical protein